MSNIQVHPPGCHVENAPTEQLHSWSFSDGARSGHRASGLEWQPDAHLDDLTLAIIANTHGHYRSALWLLRRTMIRERTSRAMM